MSIEVKDLSFRYGKIVALDGVTMRLGEGAVGLLGPNGAGKSTLLRILLGFLVPERGEGKVLDYDIRRDQAMIRRSVGYMPESDCFVAGMDAVTFTAYFGELSGMPRQEAMKRAHEVLFYVGLGESRYRLLDTYSAGMKQRLKLAQALVHDPKILFLDEPTSNLDPTGRTEVLELIRDISANKSIQVLLSSHILDDIESICEIGRHPQQGAAGRRRPDGRPPGHPLQPLRAPDQGRRRGLPQGPRSPGLPRRRDGGRPDQGLHARGRPTRMDIFRAAGRTGVQLRYFVKSQTSLEDLFAGVVGVD